MRQRELEIQLERVPRLASPTAHWEQYHTPAPIAADVLYRALARGDIAGRRIVDLGCGTGIFLVGAGLLGAKALLGIDVDPAAATQTRASLAAFRLEGTVVAGPIETLQAGFDTALMNPPFGAQRASRHADTLFVEHALRVAPVAYSLHLSETAAHLERLARRLEVDQERLADYRFPLPHQFEFHSKEKVLVPVSLYRFQRMGRR